MSLNADGMMSASMSDTELEPLEIDWDAALALQVAVSAVVGVIVTVLWGATGAGAFWPIWVWFGLAVPLGLHVSVRYALRVPAGRWRRIAVQASLTGFVAALLVTVWALAGGGTFWPLVPLVCLASPLALHSVVAALWHRIPARRERELTDRVDELTRTRRGALDVQAAELRRIERDLHDGAQARLVALSMQLGRAEERLDDRPEVADLVRRARGEASAAIAELRDLARGIAPPVLADRGLAAASEALGRRSAIPVTVEASVERRPLPVVETAAYFVVAESLTNAAKHAGGAAARVTISDGDGRLVVEVADDGPGGADPGGGGLTGCRRSTARCAGWRWARRGWRSRCSAPASVGGVGIRRLDEHPLGLSWLTDEAMPRTSHALADGGRVWLVDVVDEREALERVPGLGAVAGVLQLLDRHGRDCAAVAGRLGVPHLRVPDAVPDSPFEVVAPVRLPGWRESALWWPGRRALVVAEVVGTGPLFTPGSGAAGIHPLLRPLPPRALRRFEPEHLLVGHGEGLHGSAAAAGLRHAYARSRRDLPRLLARLPSLLRR